MSETDFWRDVQTLVDKGIAEALAHPSGVAPGVWGRVTVDRYGKVTHAEGGGPLVALCHTSASRTVTHGTGNPKVINFDTPDYDPSDTIVPGTSWLWTAPAEGWYAFSVTGAFQDTGHFFSQGDLMSLWIYLNGVYGIIAGSTPEPPFMRYMFQAATSTSLAVIPFYGRAVYHFAKDDTMQPLFFNESSFDIDVLANSYLAIEQVS